MSINPLTQAETAIITKSLQLNALDAPSLAGFYQEKIGLSLLEHDENEKRYKLGTANGEVLLEIFSTTRRNPNKTAGLYHMAFRLPTRRDLAEILLHLVENQVPMTGASDHGYSEALYLNDPEGNGIEIYWDKPVEQWDKRADGSIAGIVIRLDVNDLASLATRKFDGLPLGSDLGHMHIHVGNIAETQTFYRDKLGLGFKFPMGNQAIFMATGDYHHHLGANTWLGMNLPQPEAGVQGLRSYSWQASERDYEWIKDRLNHSDLTYTEEDEALWFKDNSGITIAITKEA